MNHIAVKSKRGRLSMLSSHLGNPLDFPPRSLEILRTADLLIFEEDRPARQALKAARVHREYLKFSEHIQNETMQTLKRCLLAGGHAAYMSDQGSPTLCDPGGQLLELAYQLQAQVVVVPGPSSITAAISACPLPLADYYFAGFLPQQTAARERHLLSLAKRQEALILLDTPYRLEALLAACQRHFPKKRKAFLALDISGEDEQYCLGKLDDLAKRVKNLEKKLNFILILEADRDPGRPLRPSRKV